MAEPLGGATITVVGLVGGVAYGTGGAAVGAADVVVGSPRQLALTELAPTAEQVSLQGPLDGVLDIIATRVSAGSSVCVLASGDPGFFGIVRVLGERFGPDCLAVHPAPSSVSLAFARLGLSWDDAVVVSVHGRPLAPAVPTLRTAAKAAVLTSPDNPPEAVGRALVEAGAGDLDVDVAVVSRIGEPDEAVARIDLTGLAAGTFDPMAVVVLVRRGDDTGAGPRPSWGLPESAFAHRDGLITKSEVRAVVLAKMALPASGVLWDVGAGSGSVGIECARLAPGVDVYAIERDAAQVARIDENAARHGVAVTVVEGAAPAALADLPDPDRVFVGGGGLDALDVALTRLRPGGVVVANYALIDRAIAAADRLGNLTQISVARGVPTGDLGLRLDAQNPVFICWGPEA